MKKEELKQEFLSHGITEFGIVSARTCQDAFLNQNGTFSYNNTANNIDDILSGCNSIIVYLVPYNNGSKPTNLSVYATGKDYHKVCDKISSSIISKLTDKGYKSVSFADIGPLNERKLAYLAGLGIIGKNNFLINDKFGSYTFIGYILTSCHFPKDVPIHNNCINCNKCYEACPGGALTPDGFDSRKCISYITQKKGTLSAAEEKLIKSAGSAWGCDICQNICPMNKDKELTSLQDFSENLILCIKDEYLSNKEFKERYHNRAFTWRGKGVIYRNLSILNDKND